jgi:trigger factor
LLFLHYSKNGRNILTMPQVVRTDSDNLNTQIVLTITKDDYEPKFKSELNKYKNKVSMKGFRKGKTPTALIRKMYGQKLLVDVINEMVQNEIFTFIKEEDLKTIGQPIPAEDQPEVDFNVNELKDMEFRFDIGLAPQFELKGVDKDTSFDFKKAQIQDAFLTEQVEAGRKRVGERAQMTEDIEGNDVVKLNANELDGKKLKKDGWAASFSILVDEIADEKVKEEILKKKAGDKITVNVFQLEKDRDADFVRKNMLNVQENDGDVEIGEMFEATIEEVNRIQLAELNQEFFDKYMGPGKVTSVEEMKEMIKADYITHYDKQADALMFRDFNDMLLEKNELPLPDAFLKRWLKTSEQNVKDNDVEEGYEEFAKSLRWSLIRGELIKKFNLEVTDDEVFEGIKEQVRGMFKQYGMAEADELIVLNTANRMAEDKEQMNKVYGEMMNEKVFSTIKGEITINETPISRDDFDTLLQEERAKAEAAQAAAQVQSIVNTETEEVEAEEVK